MEFQTAENTKEIEFQTSENLNEKEIVVLEQNLRGEKGDPFTYEDFTPEQLKALKGTDGKDGQNGQDGVDGFSPNIEIVNNNSTEYTLKITDAKGSFSTPNLKGKPFTYSDFTPEQLENLKGADGNDGVDGYTPIKGKDYFDGNDGQDGTDGISPIVDITKNGKITNLSITDKNGTKTTTFTDGLDGYTPVKGVDYSDGADGQDGVDGVSPIVQTSKNGKVTTITIKDKDGTKTATINDGIDGQKGNDGQNGTNGVDGVSPNIEVKTNSESEYILRITDKDGSFDTPNLKGSSGSQGTINYQELENKPQINGIELLGNKTSAELKTDQIYIGETEPTDENIDLWINPFGNGSTIPQVIEATTKEEALTLSQANPNNFYYWEG